MSINEIFPMRKRRQINKTPGKAPRRLGSTNSCDEKVIQQTPKRITSNNSFDECEIIWDNHSPSSRTFGTGKRKKKTVSDESGSDNNDIADLVKKLANKTGQTPQDSSLYNFWFNEQESQPANQSKNNSVNLEKKKTQPAPYLETPARKTRITRKGRKSKNKVTQELEMLASMVENTVSKKMDEHLVENKESCSSKLNMRSPITSHQENEIKPITLQGKFTPESLIKRPRISTSGTKHSSPCLSDIGDIDWDDEDVDVLLSQVDMSAICQKEDQVFTTTQRSEMDQASEIINHESNNETEDSSFVTESWDFEDDDSEELLLTLEQVEKTATQSVTIIPDSMLHITPVKQQSRNFSPPTKSCVNMIPESKSNETHVIQKSKNLSPPNMKHTVNVIPDSKSHVKKKSRNFSPPTKHTQIKQSKCSSNQDLKAQPSKCVYSKEEIERKRLEAQQRRNKSKLQNGKNRPNTRQYATCTNRLKR